MDKGIYNTILDLILFVENIYSSADPALPSPSTFLHLVLNSCIRVQLTKDCLVGLILNDWYTCQSIKTLYRVVKIAVTQGNTKGEYSNLYFIDYLYAPSKYWVCLAFHRLRLWTLLSIWTNFHRFFDPRFCGFSGKRSPFLVEIWDFPPLNKILRTPMIDKFLHFSK